MIYDIAGLRIDIRNKYTYTDRFCRGYLSGEQSSPADIVAQASEDDILAEKERTPDFSDGYIENICIYRHICQQITLKDRFLLHAAVLEYKGNAYAFLGRSGTGKSTHTGLWLKHIKGVKILNGDKPILHYTENGVFVYGTPWMGKEKLGYNGSAPLKGLCFLEQAKENEISQLSIKEPVKKIFPQILHPIREDYAARTLELVDRLILQTPSYLLRCTISEEAVKQSFEAMTGEKYDKVVAYED